MSSLFEVAVISGAQPGPHLLITGGVHGDEFEPMAAARRLLTAVPVNELRGKLTVAPCVNEGAFQRGQRTGEDGLDLARTCPGKADGTPTERVAYQLSALIRTADHYIDLHTGGTGLQVYPLTGYTLHSDPHVLEVQRGIARAFGLPLVWGTDPNLQGRSLSVARDARIPAIYAEYLGGGPCDPRGVQAYVDGCLRVLHFLGMLATAPPGRPPALVVEDPRPNSGHMQINHPAPTNGFFEPAITLGQRVSAGDLLGTVTDFLGKHRSPVAANRSGCVIVLRSFSRVAQGDSLGVVLETTQALPTWPPTP